MFVSVIVYVCICVYIKWRYDTCVEDKHNITYTNTCVVVSRGSLVSLKGRDETIVGGDVAVTEDNARAPFVIAIDCRVEVNVPKNMNVHFENYCC